LSISAGEKNEQKLDPIAQLESLEDYILVNDTEKVWEILSCDNNPKSIGKYVFFLLFFFSPKITNE
jgi:hypothetical protein